jgi:two-component system cell cycle response regulator DivK
MPPDREDKVTLVDGQGRTVLLVEDNVHNRAIFAGILAHYGYVVKEATNGVEAVEMAGSVAPDLIIMDLSLPVMDGWEATRRIKADPGLQRIPIIALTAHAMAGDEARARDAGCDGYLAKPMSPKKVVAAVQRMLEERGRGDT